MRSGYDWAYNYLDLTGLENCPILILSFYIVILSLIIFDDGRKNRKVIDFMSNVKIRREYVFCSLHFHYSL